MAVRKILQIGDPRLKAANKKILNFDEPKIKNLVLDLIDTMRKNDLVGVAAPQIGKNYKIFITEPRKTESRTLEQADELRIYINPQITTVSDEKNVIYEGCGSVAKGTLFAPVKRPKQITIEAFNEKGRKFRITCDGLLSRVIQHEYDHLFGIEFTEKILDYKKIVSKKFYLKTIKNSKKQIEGSIISIKTFSEIS